jgi:hypothetical protein
MNKNALAICSAFARENGFIVGAYSEFQSLDKTVFAVHLGRRQEDGSVRWFEPTRSDGRFAFSQMPRIVLRADGTVFRNLLFVPSI